MSPAVLLAAGKNYSPSLSTLSQKELTDEFRELRATVEQMGLMKANHGFFLLYLLHILLLDVAAWLTLWAFGTSFVPFVICALLLSAVQVRPLACQEHSHAHHSWGKFFVPSGGQSALHANWGRAEDMGESWCRKRTHIPLFVASI